MACIHVTMAWMRICLPFILFPISCCAMAQEETICTLKNEQVQFRHIEGRGIGYSQGYTTIQAFFTPHFVAFVPLVDFRGHVFDDGKFAANAGVGFRLIRSCVYGFHAYYDYRQTNHFQYNQASFGLEALGKRLDFRLEGYFPFGRERAFKGGNGEIGVHILKNETYALYGAVGPYFFERQAKKAIGGQTRFSATFLEHVRVEASGSYDPVFRWIAQASVSLMYFFGPKVSSTSVSDVLLRERSAQWIDRMEMIVIK